MKKIVLSVLLICSAAFATTRNEDLKVIFDKTFMNTSAEPLLSLIALETVTETEKQMDSEELVQEFKKEFPSEKIQAQLAEPYDALFSDEEVHELRAIVESATYQKYSQQVEVFQANLQTLKDSFKEIAANTMAVKQIIANSHVVEITQQNFDEISGSKKPVILDINATWCNPCRMMNPVIDELSDEYPNVLFAKIDYDSQPDLVKKYKVTSLPTILFIKAGQTEPVMRNTGFMDKKAFKAKIAEFLKK